MPGSLTVRVAREGRLARLSNIACTMGPSDRPYPETHERGVWTIALVRRGAFSYRAAETNRVHPVREGWLLFGAPEATFECGHAHAGGDDCASLAVSSDAVLDVIRGLRDWRWRGGASACPVLPPVPRVSAWMDRLQRGHAADVDLDEVALRLAETVVTQAHRLLLADVARHPSHRAAVEAAIAVIESRCAEPLALADLARSAGLSPFHFLRVFQRVTGTTPHQYVIGARLRRAARLLLDTRYPVTRVAYDAGFADLSNFVRTFHRVIGCSPRDFRRGRCHSAWAGPASP